MGNYFTKQSLTPGPIPASIDELAALVRHANVPCNCDQHQPQLYAQDQCANTHAFIHPQPSWSWLPRLWSPRHTATNYISPPPLFKERQAYEALYLARASVQYFSRPMIDMNETQKVALRRWDRLRTMKSGPLRKLGWAEGPRALARHHVLEILRILNDVFLFGVLELEFAWQSRDQNVLGQCIGSRIELTSHCSHFMHPNVSECEARTLSRLGTLAHEAIHAYLNQLSCPQCPTYDVNCGNAEGHGRAFHYIASAIEQRSLDLFGFQLFVAGKSDLTANWHGVRHLPSVHDLEEWKWFADMRPFW